MATFLSFPTSNEMPPATARLCALAATGVLAWILVRYCLAQRLRGLPPGLVAAIPDTGLATWRGGAPMATHALPLAYDSGVFVLPLLLGGQLVHAVVDTGSELLVVASTECRGCARSQGRYDPATASPVAALGGSETILRYGTQTDSVEFVSDTLHFIGLPEGSCAAGTAGAPVVEVPRVRFGLVVERHGESNFNILGLCAPPSGPSQSLPFLTEVMPESQLVFTVRMHPDKGWLAFGEPRGLQECTGRVPKYVSLQRTPMETVAGVPFNFYMTPLTGVTVGGTPLRTSPKFLLWDTGSNMCGTSRKVLEEMQELGLKRGGEDLEFLMTTVDGRRATLRVRPSVYCWDDGSLLVEDHAPFHHQKLNDDLFVLGSLLIQDYILEFRVSENRLGISPS